MLSNLPLMNQYEEGRIEEEDSGEAIGIFILSHELPKCALNHENGSAKEAPRRQTDETPDAKPETTPDMRSKVTSIGTELENVVRPKVARRML